MLSGREICLCHMRERVLFHIAAEIFHKTVKNPLAVMQRGLFFIQLFLFSEHNQFTENIIQNNYEHAYKSLRPKAVYTQKALI